MPPPPAPPPPRAPRTPHKSVTFCTRCERKPSPAHPPFDPDVRYYSDPGQPESPPPRAEPGAGAADAEQRYYSEPDVKYFEIDYEFLKELRRIARNNCPKCKRRRARGPGRGRCPGDPRHCRLCCRVCARSTDTLDSNEDECSLASRSSSLPAAGPRCRPARRKASVQSGKSVSFVESSAESMKADEPNYTAKSFTNDLKRFLLKPSPPRLSLRDKFMISFKQELEATKRSPKLRAIKGLWKSY